MKLCVRNNFWLGSRFNCWLGSRLTICSTLHHLIQYLKHETCLQGTVCDQENKPYICILTHMVYWILMLIINIIYNFTSTFKNSLQILDKSIPSSLFLLISFLFPVFLLGGNIQIVILPGTFFFLCNSSFKHVACISAQMHLCQTFCWMTTMSIQSITECTCFFAWPMESLLL